MVRSWAGLQSGGEEEELDSEGLVAGLGQVKAALPDLASQDLHGRLRSYILVEKDLVAKKGCSFGAIFEYSLWGNAWRKQGTWSPSPAPFAESESASAAVLASRLPVALAPRNLGTWLLWSVVDLPKTGALTR